FQADDGIRHDLVTGVQTCALPIYSSASRSTGPDRRATLRCSFRRPSSSATRWSAPFHRASSSAATRRLSGSTASYRRAASVAWRSEERRVREDEIRGWGGGGAEAE